MALVPMKAILDAAEKGNYGVVALNINEMLQLQAYLNAAFELRSPVILQASMGSRQFTGWLSQKDPDPNLGAGVTIGMIKTFIEHYKEVYGYDIPVAITLDHGPSFEHCKGAIDNGFTAVMIDGSIDYTVKDKNGKHPPRSFEDNIKATKEVADYAHRYGVTVEGELGTLGGIEDETATSEVQLTDPDKAGEFVEKTGVDCLAVAIGTSHGAYKFKVAPKLALDLIPKISQNAKRPLVMHGSSSVPQEMVALINEHPVIHLVGTKEGSTTLEITGLFKGEDDKLLKETRSYGLSSTEDMAKCGNDLTGFKCMKKSMGVPMEQIKEAIGLGIRKINVDTDGRLGTTGDIRKYMAENPDVFDQRKYFEKARLALYNMAVSKIKGFGSIGHADDVEKVTLAEIAKRYVR